MKSFFLKYGIWLLLLAAAYQFGGSLIGHKHKNKYIWSDAEGYYMYLPAVLQYGTFENFPVRTKAQFQNYPGTNKIFTKYTYGVALMEMPFFCIAAISRSIQGTDAYNYEGVDYSVMLLMGACFYGLLGIFFLWKTLQRHVKNKWAILLTLGTLLLATNLLHYMARTPGMSHVYSFCLLAALVYLTPTLFEKSKNRDWLLFGFVFGMVVLIRPTNAVAALYPILYGVTSRKEFSERLHFFLTSWKKVLLAILPVLLVWVPQLIYWRYASGEWIFYSYKDESFKYWANPQIHKVFFDVLNGWFVYNPVMMLAVIGLPFLIKGNRLNGWSVNLIFLISTYLFGSWWCWWFGGAFGQRSYVDLLPFLAFPLCFVILSMLETRHKWLTVLGLALLVVLCFFNIRMNVLYESGWSDHTWTWGHYWYTVERAFFLK